jgi:DNA invertase Pin-like site-specific DNA recombinase
MDPAVAVGQQFADDRLDLSHPFVVHRRMSRFTEEQIIKVLKKHSAGLSPSEVCRKFGISDATFYK